MIARKGILLILTWCLGMRAFASDDLAASALRETGGGHEPVYLMEESTLPVPGPAANPIVYHGGPVLLGTPRVYYIWYGNWTGPTGAHAAGILNNLAMTIGGSPYFNINQTYSSHSGPVSGAIAWGGAYYDHYSQGTILSDAAVLKVVKNAIAGGHLARDANGVYLVLSSADVQETSGFCTYYCGWHTSAPVSGTDIKYAFVGNPATQCMDACAAQSQSSPNGDPGADAMAAVIVHELSEAVTDPHLNAWHDRQGHEIADACAWDFGTVRAASNNSIYNVVLGGAQYLLPQLWENRGAGYCSLAK